MSHIHAAELIRRLRSNGVKVYLNPAGQAAFKGLDEASPALKQEVIQYGHAILTRLKDEQALRAHRERMRRKPVNNHHIPEVKPEEL